MQFNPLRKHNLPALMLSVLAVPAAHATYTISVQQVGSNVVATGNGQIGLSSLTNVGNTTGIPETEPSTATLAVGLTNSVSLLTIYSGASGPSTFGTGLLNLADTGSGPHVGIVGSDSDLYVPEHYGSGFTFATSTDTWTNQTISSLGLTPGTYTWTWGFEPGPTDSFTVQIGPTPEPTSLSLLAFTGLALLRRRQRASAGN